LTGSQWARKLGIKVDVLNLRLSHYNWTVERGNCHTLLYLIFVTFPHAQIFKVALTFARQIRWPGNGKEGVVNPEYLTVKSRH
jgi:hypothetical protein